MNTRIQINYATNGSSGSRGQRALLLCLLLLVCGTSPVRGQSVESIGPGIRQLNPKNLALEGGVNLSSNFYTSNSIDPRRDAFQWVANINLNLGLGPINAPFSFTFSEGNQQFGLPAYTFTGISPTYKWATLHAGDRSMHFSRYTMSGINFRGVGVELTPGKFRFKSMYGRLTKANAEDLNSRQSLDAAYERRGFGMMAGYATDDFSMDLILFRASDDETSIVDPLISDITPAENLVASLQGRKAFGNKFILDAEFARSGLNEDRRTADAAGDFTGIGQRFLGLFSPTATATYGNAFNSGLTFNQKKYSLRLGYEKVDRGFRTLGTLFFNQDLVHYTGTVSTRLLKNKLSLVARGGLETTNRQDLNKPSNDRLVASFNAAYVPNSRWMFNASFSNFENSTKIRARENPGTFVDSLFLAQLTQSVTFSSSYQLREKVNPMSLSLVFSTQQASSVLNEVVQQNTESRFNNGNLILNQRISDHAFSWTASLNYNRSNFASFNTTTLSPTLMLTKALLDKKLNSSLRLTYNAVNIENGGNSTVLNMAFSNRWAFFKNQSIGLTLNYVNRNGSNNEMLNNFSELYGRLIYNYQFDLSANRETLPNQ